MAIEAPKLFLVGNPNVGKSVIFGHLTGSYATVSNYPGTTVSLSKGSTHIGDTTYTLIDTPGVNSLLPMSEDERVTRDLLLKEEGIVIQVADAKNLARALPLTFQLQEMGVPLLLVLNMWDEAVNQKIVIDAPALEKALGIPVLTTVAIRGTGMTTLREKILLAKRVQIPWTYAPIFDRSIAKVIEQLPQGLASKNSIATMLLSGDKKIGEWIGDQLTDASRTVIENESRHLAAHFAEPVSFLLGRERSLHAQQILNRVVVAKSDHRSFGTRLGAWAMHPFWGLVTLAVVLELVYLFVGKLGAGTAVDFIENGLFGKYISPWAVAAVDQVLGFPETQNGFLQLVRDGLVGEYGLITMGVSYGFAIVLPIVTTFFIAFSLMEDSGYLPRLAIMVNRMFKWMGLNGKAVLPMVLGLGCDTMATLTTRILETRKQRVIVTLLLALAVPCSAQLGVLLGMFGTMPAWTFAVWVSVIVGIMFLVGYASNKIIAGEGSAFVMEIPPLRLPQLGNVAKKTLSRLEWYIKEAIPLFLLGTFILFLLDAVHLLEIIQRLASPLVVSVLGLPKEAANAFLIGFLRRDYGATGFFDMYTHGNLSVVQALVALVVITLFIPCVANVFMIIKEHGMKTAARMVFFIVPFAFLVGGLLQWILR